MLVKVYGAAVQGIDATIVTIEVNSSRGIKFFLVGLPDSAVKESHERIISALQVNGYKFPTCQIVVNMAPADIRKEGSAYDLPLAIGILAATQIVSEEKLSRYLIIGELSLDGSLQPVKGALSIAISAREQGFEGFILPKQNAREPPSSRIWASTALPCWRITPPSRKRRRCTTARYQKRCGRCPPPSRAQRTRTRFSTS